MAEEIWLTQQGLEEIKKEYEILTSVTRQEIAEQIREARDFGDISENAEYDAAKSEQADIEDKIRELEYTIRNAKIIAKDLDDIGIINMGDIVTIRENGEEETKTYQIIGAREADPFASSISEESDLVAAMLGIKTADKFKARVDSISNESAIGSALLGKKEGDLIEVELPRGKVEYEVVKIEDFSDDLEEAAADN